LDLSDTDQTIIHKLTVTYSLGSKSKVWLNTYTRKVQSDTDQILSIAGNGTGYVRIGTTGSSNHGLNSENDLYVKGKFEVDGLMYIDYSCSVYGNITFRTGRVCNFGDAANSTILFNGTQTNPCLFVGVDETSRSLLIADKGDYTYDFSHAAESHPTIFLHSANQSTTEYLKLQHNGTDGLIGTGTGKLTLQGANGNDLSTTNGVGLQIPTSAASSPVAGSLYADTSNKTLKLHDGSAWQDLEAIPIFGTFKKISEVELSSDTNQITFTGLDINTHKIYVIYANMKNADTSNPLNSDIYINGDTTETNYYTEQIYASGSTVSAQNNNRSMFLDIPAGQTAICRVFMMRTIDDHVRMVMLSNRNEGTDLMIQYNAIFYTQTATNITQIDIKVRTGNNFASGSKIYLFGVSK